MLVMSSLSLLPSSLLLSLLPLLLLSMLLPAMPTGPLPSSLPLTMQGMLSRFAFISSMFRRP
jgi:hypothetical protein